MMRDCLKHGPTFRSSMTCPECLREAQAAGLTYGQIFPVKKPESGVIEPMAYPVYMPKSGDVLILTRSMITFAKRHYSPGDKFELVELTAAAPFDFQSGLGNWLVKCKHFEPPAKEACWSSIWHMIDNRTLVPESVYESSDFKPAHVGHFIGDRDAGTTTQDRGSTSKAD